jgi:hypothetical protein
MSKRRGIRRRRRRRSGGGLGNRLGGRGLTVLERSCCLLAWRGAASAEVVREVD